MAEIASFGVNVDQNTRLAQNAQDTADDANAKNSANSQQIANINDPNYLSPFEKPQLQVQMDNFATLYTADKDIATAEGIDFTAYDAAYQAYLAYMTPLIADMTTYSPIVRATFNSMVTAVQAEQKRFSTATQAQYNQQINQARTDIADGQTKYQALQDDAEAIKTSVAGVADAASRAISNAGFASDAASAASQAASSAVATANEAAVGVTVAKSDAASAVAKAESTAYEFGPVKQSADSAVASALNAQSDASAAVIQASSAAADATTAKGQAANALGQANTAINNAASALDKFNNMQVGGVNLLLDTDFNNLPQYWTERSGTVTGTFNGHNVIHYDAQTITSNFTNVLQQPIYNPSLTTNRVLPNQWYTLSFYAKGLGQMTSYVYDSFVDIGAGCYIDGVKSNYAGSHGNHTWDLTDGWTRHTYTFKSKPSFQSMGVQNVLWRLFKGNKVYICMPQLEAGTLVTDWSAAPEDVQQQFTNIDGELASKVNQTAYNVLAGTVDTVNTLAKQNQSTISTLATKTSVDTVNNTATTAQTLAQQNATELLNKANSTTVNTLTQRVTTAESTLKQTATTAQLALTQKDIDDLNDTVTSNNAGMTANANALKLKADSSTVSSLDGRVTKLSGQLDVQADKIAATVTASDVTGMLNGYATETWTQNQIKLTSDSLSGTLSSVKSTVDGQTTDINDLQADSKGFKEQFTTVTNAVGKHTTDISTLQASSKELTTGFNTLTTDNGTNKNDISQLKQTSKEVNSTLETVQTQVTDSAVGTNLLVGTSTSVSITGTNSSNQIVRNYALAGGMSAYNLYQKYGSTFTLSYNWSVTDTANTYAGKMQQQFNNEPWGTSDNNTISSSNKSGHKVITLTLANNSANIATGLESRLDNVPTTSKITVSKMKLEKGSCATDYSTNPADNATVTALMQVKQTADGAEALATNNKGDITSIQETAKGLQSSVNSKVSSDQLTQLSDQLTNKISDLSSSTSSQFTQTASDINNMVKKGDVANQLNIDAGGILLDTSGSTAKIILSSNNIELDSANPVVMGSANITNLLTSKTIEASSITSTTKIIGSDIQAAMIHSTDNAFVLDGDKGSIMGATITSTDNSWSISPTGKITGADVYAGGTYTYVASGSGNTVTGAIYNELNSNGYHQWTDANDHVRINNGTIGITNDEHEKANIDSVDGIPLGVLISDGQSQFTGNVSITNNLQVGNLYTNGYHTINSMDGGAVFLENGVNSGNDMVDFHAGVVFTGGLHTNNLSMNNGHTIASADGGTITMKDSYNGGGNYVNLHVKKLYQSSLLSVKTDITPIDPHDALTELVKNDVMAYHYKTDPSGAQKSVSVVLDDVNPIPKYYTSDIFKSDEGDSRNDGNIVGYLMLSIKDLNNRLQKLEGAN